MFNILSQITLKVKFLRNEEQHCLLPSLVDDFTCVHSKNALLTHILSTLFSNISVLFSCTPFGTKSYIYVTTIIHAHMDACTYDLVPKGVQEKRTEVLENKVDRMWVSNAFFWMNTVKSSTSEGRRQCCSLFLRNLTFSVICDKMLNITHYNKPTSLCC